VRAAKKKILVIAGSAVALIVVAASAAALVFNVNAYKPEIEAAVSDATGLVVSIDHHDDHGTLTIRYRSLEQLDDLVQRLVRGQ